MINNIISEVAYHQRKLSLSQAQTQSLSLYTVLPYIFVYSSASEINIAISACLFLAEYSSIICTFNNFIPPNELGVRAMSYHMIQIERVQKSLGEKDGY